MEKRLEVWSEGLKVRSILCKKNKKANFLTDNLGWILVGVGVLIIGTLGILMATGKGQDSLAYVRNILRFRGVA